MKAAKFTRLVTGVAPSLRILLVEDNDSDAMVARAAIEKAVRGEREILRATTLRDGLAILRLGNVDLVLLDLNLPDSAGLNTLRSVHVATSCPIIVVTAEDRPGLDEEALRNGAFEILHKGRLGKNAIARLIRLAEDRHRAQGLLEDAEHRFRSLTELSSDWYWEQDQELRFTYYSPGFAQRSGSTPERNLGKRRWEEPGRAPLRGTWEEHRALLAARKPFRDLEFVRVDKDGARSFQSVNGEPFYDKAGKFAGYRGASRDITERKLAEEALEQTRSRLELALAASRVCTWDYDLASGEVLLSEAWAEMIGATPGETRTTIKALVDMVHPEDAASLRRALADTVKDLRTEYSVEHRVRREDGEWRWIVSRGRVVGRDARGRALRVVGTNLDISERKWTEKALRESEARLRTIIETSPECVKLISPEGLLLDMNLAGLRMIEADSLAQVRNKAMLSLVTPAHRPAFADLQRRVLSGERGELSFEIVALKGTRRWLQTRAVPLRDAEGAVTALLGVTSDITERMRADEVLRESEARFRSLTDLSSDWYWEQDEELRFTYVSPGFSQRTDADSSMILGRRRWEFDDVVPASGTWPEHRAVLEARRPFRDFEQIRVGEDGARRFIASSGIPVFDGSGNFKGYCGVSSDITERRSAEKRLVYLAQYDPVTGLPNRNLLQQKLEDAIVQSRRRGRGAGVLFIDLDRFKLVNDTLGHQAGDALLSQVGRSLKDCVRQDDTVGRLAGDEFAVVIADLARPEDAALVAQKIVDSFAAPFDLGGNESFLTASIGIAAFPGDGENADSLLRCADAAMYRAKESARNSFCFYTAEMNTRTAAKLQLNNDLRRAVERHEFRLHYQPKVNLVTGALTGMEALLRWQHPARGMVAPLDFIPALEDTGLIVAVGDWVIEEACRQLRDWMRDGLAPLPIAVNLSARQFRRPDLDAVIRGIVAAHGLQAGLLELEITESSLMADPVDAIRQLHALRAAGLRISVDDFGTGYSSLSYLTRLPLSTLKIDRAFVNAAISDPSSAAIVKMVIDMAQNLGFNVVAEGIETVEHVAFLRKHGCEQGQGYHFGRPVPAGEIASRLSRRA